MTWLAKLLPFQYYIAAALGLCLVGWGTSAEWRLHTSQANEAKSEAALKTYIATANKTALVASENARAEEQRRATAQKEIVNDTIRKTAVVVADAASAADAHDRLLQRLHALIASRGPATGHPASASSSASASGSGLVFAKLFGSIDEAAGRYAAIADERGIAGDACVRAYEALGK